jgi:hypothetical protein
MSFSAKNRPARIYRTCEEKHRQKSIRSPGPEEPPSVSATIAFVHASIAITFKDNVQMAGTQARLQHFLQQSPRDCSIGRQT